MNETAKFITEYGILVVIAAAFILISWRRFTWSMKKYDDLCSVHEDAIKEFTKISANFQVVIQNHMEHETMALSELTRAIERLCVRLEAPNRDYLGGAYHDYGK